MMFLLGTHHSSDETSENTDQHTALVYWDRADTHTLILNTFGSWSSVCMFWQHFSFFCWWYSREVMKKCLWLQMAVWRRRTNQVCYYQFLKIFHVLCNGICCVFSTHTISVAEKDFHDVNPNFLVPSHSFSQCRVIRQHLIWSINSWHMVVVDMNNVWLPFGFVMPVDWIHHCWHMSIADDTDIPFIFPLSDRNVTKGHENHFTLSKLLSNYLWWVSLSITTQGASNLCIPFWHIFCEWYRIVPIVCEQMVAFV